MKKDSKIQNSRSKTRCFHPMYGYQNTVQVEDVKEQSKKETGSCPKSLMFHEKCPAVVPCCPQTKTRKKSRRNPLKSQVKFNLYLFLPESPENVEKTFSNCSKRKNSLVESRRNVQSKIWMEKIRFWTVGNVWTCKSYHLSKNVEKHLWRLVWSWSSEESPVKVIENEGKILELTIKGRTAGFSSSVTRVGVKNTCSCAITARNVTSCWERG